MRSSFHKRRNPIGRGKNIQIARAHACVCVCGASFKTRWRRVHTIRLLITLSNISLHLYITSLIYTFYSLFSRLPLPLPTRLCQIGLWNMIFASPPIEISPGIVNLLSQCSEYIQRDKAVRLVHASLTSIQAKISNRIGKCYQRYFREILRNLIRRKEEKFIFRGLLVLVWFWSAFIIYKRRRFYNWIWI